MFAYSDSVPRDRNTRLDGPGFAITDGKGFQIRFENGWTVSVQFGGGNYSENYNLDIGSERTLGVPPSERAEIAAWDANGTWYKWTKRLDDDDAESGTYTDTVAGWQTTTEVLAFINMIAAMPDGSPQDAGS